MVKSFLIIASLGMKVEKIELTLNLIPFLLDILLFEVIIN
jgi:hypothetical protein